MLLFYQELKNEVKNELIKIEWSDNLDEMTKIIVQIDNYLWKNEKIKWESSVQS